MTSLWLIWGVAVFYLGIRCGRHYEALCQQVKEMRRQLRDNPPSPPEGGA